MKAGRATQFFKTYFYFSKQERKGIIALSVLLLATILFPRIYLLLFPGPELNFKITELPSLSETSATSQLFFFDPNTAKEEQLKVLGFTGKNIQTLHRFKASGKRFNSPEELSKLYGLDKRLCAQLIPFVKIGQPDPHRQFPVDSVKPKKPALHYPVELNTADSETLVALYRIGPSLAHRMIEYRTKLGGFLSLQQLTEIWGFDEDILYDLEGKIKVNPALVHRFELNTVSVEELKSHPYFKYKLSNAIVNYRMQHGKYGNMEDLKKIPLVNDSVYQKITLYLYVL